eukprot:Selendium_serpulae@DN444_c0_g1_i2.p1
MTQSPSKRWWRRGKPPKPSSEIHDFQGFASSIVCDRRRRDVEDSPVDHAERDLATAPARLFDFSDSTDNNVSATDLGGSVPPMPPIPPPPLELLHKITTSSSELSSAASSIDVQQLAEDNATDENAEFPSLIDAYVLGVTKAKREASVRSAASSSEASTNVAVDRQISAHISNQQTPERDALKVGKSILGGKPKNAETQPDTEDMEARLLSATAINEFMMKKMRASDDALQHVLTERDALESTIKAIQSLRCAGSSAECCFVFVFNGRSIL